jgi:hypothetical protein
MQFESILHDEWPEEQTDTHIDNRDPLSNLLALARKRSVSFVLGCHAEGRIAIGDCCDVFQNCAILNRHK